MLEIAPAVYVGPDKMSFELCSFIGLQDTLSGTLGRHYFNSCYIEGVVDFIWGFGQSVYQNCTINATAHVLAPGLTGFIAAQGRTSAQDESGYVFSGDEWLGLDKGTITYAEIACTGPGSDVSNRVKWMKDPPDRELQPLVDIQQFINQDGWLNQTTTTFF
ncbi:hypothetical protein MLD38_001525 [Melastoma candidum]|uniref:Uncharacterized protein n=1 Tax=Melastoma candidum TaxID=119954 RepID=A0ACB9SHG8_9MYRT|nr:hypothetical protein MLD38_001525 [Melastoma candidum]